MRRLPSLLVIALLVGLGAPTVAWASNHDQTQFFLPRSGSRTEGVRVHQATTRAHQNLTIATGNIWAAGGYKTPIRFTHLATASQSQSIALTGTAVTQQRLGAEGSVIGISAAASVALTAGTATCAATLRKSGVVTATGLTASIGTGPTAAHPQFHHASRARGVHTFGASDELGAQLTTTADITPVGANILCTVIAEF